MKKVLLTSLLVCIAFVTFSCGSGSKSRSAEGKQARLPLGFLDSPRPGEAIRNGYMLSGWAFNETGIQEVSVYLDRRHWGTARLGIDRQDLRSAYPQYPNVEKSGFQYEMPLTGVNPGPHDLIVQAKTTDGTTRDLGSLQVQIVP